MCSFVSGTPSGRTNNYPESGRGLGHVTPATFGIRSNISLKLLEPETSNLIHGFVWAMPSRRINNFPKSRRGLGHVTLQFLAVRSAILATAWLLVLIGCEDKWFVLPEHAIAATSFASHSFNMIP